MQKIITVITLLLLACVSTLAGAGEAAVRAAMRKNYPDFVVESVTKTPLAGIYEVFANGQLIYTNEKATYVFLNAHMMDTKKKADLTEERLNRLTAIKFDQLPLDLAFKRVKGKGTRQLAYFGDPNCGYCKKFEQDLANVDDVTIHVFLLPVLGPDSMAKAKSIWCSKDQLKAWNDQLVNGIAPTAPESCDTPIEKILAFARQKNITGTPTMFFSDGQRIPGAIPIDEIEQHLLTAAKSTN